MARPSVTGLFGKVPAYAEFVRVRAAEPSAHALVAWLEEGSERAARAGAQLGTGPVRFLFRPPGAARAVVGAVAGSSDSAGRRFPLVAFATSEDGALADGAGALAAAARPFLDAAAALLSEASGLSAQEVTARVESLPRWEEARLLDELGALRDAAAATPVRDFLGDLFGDLADGQAWYGLHCFRTACQALRGRELAADGVVLDCPASREVDRFAWLELARRLLRWSRPPTFFWTEDEPGRLLVALGAPPAFLLGALWDRSRHEARLWSLTTGKSGAIAAAQRALGPAVVGVLERPGATVMDLLSTLER